MQKMNAVVKVKPGPGAIEYREWDIPRIGTGDVLIKVEAAGLCGTDLHLYDWPENLVQAYKPKIPMVMGHEFAGTVAEVGPEVRNLNLGDRVTVMPMLYCGQCYFCKDGREAICDDRPLLGLEADGAFAEFVSVRSTNIYKLDENVSFMLGALTEIACVGLHAIERARLESGDTVAVVGTGPLGLVTMILAKHSGAARIFVTGLKVDRRRLEVAENIGAIPIEVESTDPKQYIMDYTDGLGADVVFEAAGSPPGVRQSLDIVRKGGTVCLLGQGHESTEIQTRVLSLREIDVIGSRAYTPKHWHRVSRMLLNAADDFDQIITHRLPLSRAEQGIQLMKAREGLKIILLPEDG